MDRALDIMERLLARYCSAMASEYDYPGDRWSPERDGQEAARDARDLLREHNRPSEWYGWDYPGNYVDGEPRLVLNEEASDV